MAQETQRIEYKGFWIRFKRNPRTMKWIVQIYRKDDPKHKKIVSKNCIYCRDALAIARAKIDQIKSEEEIIQETIEVEDSEPQRQMMLFG